ncbi:SgcJ/EcaC family oxidoreductase [Hyphococcus sp.]|uniref:SgcJ/EcaC family oxidoreductase n=1 Tax=Hyphococcus sp. TaxID=2038636 RepID=UPI003CCBF3AC
MFKLKRLAIKTAFVLLGVLCTLGCARSAAENDIHDDIDAVIINLESAWAAADGEAWSDQFTDDADFIVWFGLRLHGAKEIGDGHQGIWDDFYAGTVFDLEIESARLIADGVAIAHLDGWIYRAGESRPQTPAVSKPIVVLAQTERGWKIEAFQNTPGFGPQCFGNELADVVARGGCVAPGGGE